MCFSQSVSSVEQFFPAVGVTGQQWTAVAAALQPVPTEGDVFCAQKRKRQNLASSECHMIVLVFNRAFFFFVEQVVVKRESVCRLEPFVRFVFLFFFQKKKLIIVDRQFKKKKKETVWKRIHNFNCVSIMWVFFFLISQIFVWQHLPSVSQCWCLGFVGKGRSVCLCPCMDATCVSLTGRW